MATDLQTITANPIAELTKLMTPLVSSALVGDTWRADWGKRVLDRERIDIRPLVTAHEASLAPVDRDWLAERLRILWKSSTPSNGLDATAWLHEMLRLLADLPLDLAAIAIDEAVKRSPRGFLPAVGEIRAHSDPQLKRRRLHLGRLREMAALEPEPPLKPEERCTPEQAAKIIADCGIKIEGEAIRSEDYIPVEQRTGPTREDYIRWGYEPPEVASPMPPTPQTPSRSIAA